MESDRPLEPKQKAIVVGASSGMGAEVVRELARQGYRVAALARRQPELDALCEELNGSTPGTVIAYPHDVTQTDEVAPLFQRIVEEIRGVDLFIYVAGVMHMPGENEFNFEIDRDHFAVNTLGAIAWLNQAAIRFRRLGAGQLVCVSSVAGDRGRVKNPTYNASKAAISTYMEALRNRLSRHGITVTTIKPGFVKTDMLRKSNGPVFGAISAAAAGKAIVKAAQQGRQTVYVPGWWRAIMLIIRHIPSFIFRRLTI